MHDHSSRRAQDLFIVDRRELQFIVVPIVSGAHHKRFLRKHDGLGCSGKTNALARLAADLARDLELCALCVMTVLRKGSIGMSKMPNLSQRAVLDSARGVERPFLSFVHLHE